MYEESLNNLNKAINLKPDHLPTIKSKARLLLKMDMKEQCLEFLEKVIPSHPKEAELYHQKAILKIM